jgi:hypothetical protein
MITIRISPEHTLHIPDQFHKLLPAGQEVAISSDAQGRLVITPLEQIHTQLLETFGMWADRDDLPTDSVDYVDEIRRGQRLNAAGLS